MPSIAVSDISRMREKLFFEGDDSARKLSAFWTLLLLSAVIASAGVVSDSTATVIGAMIVAPLMTPIVGVVLALGSLPAPDPDELRERLDAEGLADVSVRLQLVPEERIELEGSDG